MWLFFMVRRLNTWDIFTNLIYIQYVIRYDLLMLKRHRGRKTTGVKC